MKKCKTCVNFEPGYWAKGSFDDRVDESMKKHPTLSSLEASALANDRRLWGKRLSGYGECLYHEIEKIPDSMVCDNYKKK